MKQKQDKLTYSQLFFLLREIADNDCYLVDFLVDDFLDETLYLLDLYNIIFLASDDRILLTIKGWNILQQFSLLSNTQK